MELYFDSKRAAALDLLKARGPMNAPELAEALGVTVTAVRQRLSGLERDGLVGARWERRAVGRPTRVWGLTARSLRLFPQGYGPFALALLRQIRESRGEAAVDSLLRAVNRKRLKHYRDRLQGMALEARLRELAKIRTEEGYMAKGTGGRLREGHCPIADIAGEFPAVCRLEKALFEKLLGPLDREEHILSGARACVYRFRT